MKNFILLLTGVVLLTVSGCADKGDDPTSPAGGSDNGEEIDVVSYATLIQPIWDGSCVVCHGQDGNGGLDLRSGVSRANLVGVDAGGYPAVRVVAADADASVLYGKITDSGQFGGPMPPAGSLLSADTRELVRRWIAEGALDN